MGSGEKELGQRESRRVWRGGGGRTCTPPSELDVGALDWLVSEPTAVDLEGGPMGAFAAALVALPGARLGGICPMGPSPAEVLAWGSEWAGPTDGTLLGEEAVSGGSNRVAVSVEP